MIFPYLALCYSSGRCQIIHWREGHKEDCHPPSTTTEGDGVVDGQKVAEQEHGKNFEQKPEVEVARSKTVSKKPFPSETSSSPEVSFKKDDNISVEHLAEGNITDSNSESSNSFSGFSSSPVSSESSDDASVCESVISSERESVISCEHERSEGHISVDPNTLDTTTSDSGMGITNSSSPKFASLVDSVDGFSTMHKLHQIRSDFIKESKLAKNGTSSMNMCKGVTIEPRIVSSGFWDKTLDSKGIKDDAYNDPPSSHSNESAEHKRSVSGSSFNVSVSTLPPLNVQGHKEEGPVSDDALPNSVGNMASAVSASAGTDSMDSLNRRDSVSVDSKGFNNINYGTARSARKDNFGPPLSSFIDRSSGEGKNSGRADASSISNLQFVGSKSSKNKVVNPDSTSHHLKSVEVRHLPSSYADAQLASRTEGNSHSGTTGRKNGAQSGIITSSHDANCSSTPKNGLKTSVLKVVDQFRGSNLSKHSLRAVGSDIAGRYSDKVLLEQILLCFLCN